MVTHIPTGLLLLLLLVVPGKGPALDAIEQQIEVVFVVENSSDYDDEHNKHDTILRMIMVIITNRTFS